MTEEEKELLIRDLCGRLPYGIKVCARFNTGNPYTANVTAISADRDYIQIRQNDLHPYTSSSVEDIRPYLRPMSSMTKEEFLGLTLITELQHNQLELVDWWNGCKTLEFYLSEIPHYRVIKVFDWLNIYHFDYRGLIEKGLALKAPEGMYLNN